MAKVSVVPEFIAQKLFEGAELQITGASFDAKRHVVVFDIEGPSVPDAEHVVCYITRPKTDIRFEPIER